MAHTTISKKKKIVFVPHCISNREYALFSFWKKNVRIHLDESWFWTSGWQKKEAEADIAIKNKQIHGPFYTAHDLLKALKK